MKALNAILLATMVLGIAAPVFADDDADHTETAAPEVTSSRRRKSKSDVIPRLIKAMDACSFDRPAGGSIAEAPKPKVKPRRSKAFVARRAPKARASTAAADSTASTATTVTDPAPAKPEASKIRTVSDSGEKAKVATLAGALSKCSTCHNNVAAASADTFASVNVAVGGKGAVDGKRTLSAIAKHSEMKAAFSGDEIAAITAWANAK